MPAYRRIIIMAFSTGIIAALAASLSVEWMRYLMVVLIGIVAALFWQLNEVREEAERRVVGAASHHLNNGLSVMNLTRMRVSKLSASSCGAVFGPSKRFCLR
jgi:hypothetical protein